MPSVRRLLSGIAVSLLALAHPEWRVLADEPAAAKTPVDFVREIQPLLAAHCHECHGGKRQEGGLRLNDRAIGPGRRRFGPKGDRAVRSQGQPTAARRSTARTPICGCRPREKASR